MGFGGGGTTQSTTGSGSSSSEGHGSSANWSSGYSNPVLYNYDQLLTPWQKSGQQKTLASLMQQAASGGLTPDEERSLLGTIREETDLEFDQQRADIGAKAVASGLSPSSPVVIGERGNLGAAQIAARAGAALKFAKEKIASGETARSDLLSALYSTTPYTTGTSSSSQSESRSIYDNIASSIQSSLGSTESGGSK